MRLLCLLLIVLLSACKGNWNDPYPAHERGQNILYTAFSERPKHLDPALSYSEPEGIFLGQIYEPPLQYHYLKRPYELIPASVEEVPQPIYLDAKGQVLPKNVPDEQIAYSDYVLRIRPDVRYQPHPAFAKNDQGQALYTPLAAQQLAHIDKIADFPNTGSREVIAADYLYQIKRLANPRLHSPIFASMSTRIVGLKALSEALQKANSQIASDAWLDLEPFPLEGVQVLDKHRLRIRVHGKYPQFVYWLAMNFFAPVPREVDRFYSQPGMAAKNLTLDWYPVGTGPYMLIENDPNSRMVLQRNPNFHAESYPCEGEEGDEQAGLLNDCGKTLPMIERVMFSLEKESIPYWNKFLQGYYDASGIASESFDQAVRVNVSGDIQLSDEMRAQGITLLTSVRPSIFYTGFNMLDPLVGGTSPSIGSTRARKLRQAISIAIDQEEFISIFLNGRGIPAMNPIPQGIFGHEEGKDGINPVVYDWIDGRATRKSISVAKRLLAEAGWPHGRDQKSGEPLVIYLDTTSGGLGDKAQLDWLTRQFAAIDIQLVVRSTDFNRFQEKLRKGATQLYFLGWNADYPDPENFFFLLQSAESRALHSGENSSNYANPEFDHLFEQMKAMDNGAPRLALIRKMNQLIQNDAPWIFNFYPKNYTLAHAWVHNRKPSSIGQNTLKYQRIDVSAREAARRQWNTPMRWPLWILGSGLAIVLFAALNAYSRREQGRGKTRSDR